MDYQFVDYYVNNEVAWVTLCRDSARNALSLRMSDELHDIFSHLSLDRNVVRVVVLTGKGNSFCSGGDIKEVASTKITSIDNRDYVSKIARIIIDMQMLEIPILCAVNGPAMGAGFSLALAGDIIVAKSSAVFQQAFVKIGLIPDLGSTHFLPWRIGVTRAKELVMTGKKLTPHEALDWGLITEVVPDTLFQEKIQDWVDVLRKGPTRALGMAKKLLHANPRRSIIEALEEEAQAQSLLISSVDAKEGLAAFREKRNPDFIGK